VPQTPHLNFDFDSIQSKALRINGIKEQLAKLDPNIHNYITDIKMHTRLSVPDLKLILPQPFVVKQAIRTSLPMPSHALNESISKIYYAGKTFIHSVVQIWNGLPDSWCSNGVQS